MDTFENITTLTDLSRILKIPKKKLSYVLYIKKIENLYTSFKIPKKSGGERTINTPSTDLKDIQKNIVNLLWKQQTTFWNENNIKPNISHAFVKKKSIISNAYVHKNKRYVFNIDLEDFFDSFHFGRVRGFFEKNKNFLFPQNIATVLAQLTCYNSCLPQGAPSSPIITNLICNILDMRLLKIAKKFKLDYTRYADDLTFSTNDKYFLRDLEKFKIQTEAIIKYSGFKINKKKTRLQYRDSRQVVTGLTVNKKVNVSRDFYKETRAMAYSLYKNGNFMINGQPATINQLEGRLSFINHVDRENNKTRKKNNKNLKLNLRTLNAREKQYQMFLFYKYFMANENPCILTEGKTDITYIKCALKKLYKDYPKLIKINSDGTFQYKISFLNRTKRLKYFFDLELDGADTMSKIYNFYSNKNKDTCPNYNKTFNKLGVSPKNPFIFILDNELCNKNKPLKKLTNQIDLDKTKLESLSKNNFINLTSNLYISTHPLVNGLAECEIEDLFDDNTLNTIIREKTFERNPEKYNDQNNYGKAAFADYVSKNYKKIDFNNFKPLLDAINEIVSTYTAT